MSLTPPTAGWTSDSASSEPPRELFGHPVGLFTLFFAEMWERFSYYGMRALLMFYMIKGFLGYNDHKAYAVYGAYTALVYATPFIGGMLADRLLGARRAVVLGGLLMAAGHLLMTIETELMFFGALALLIVGNGFFKPNISTIVGSLYPEGRGKRDGGFTIFYMGINLGAAMSPVLCGYVGETYGWHYGFGLATAGMLVGVAIFVVPARLTQVLILGGAVTTAVCMLFFQETILQLAVRIFLGIALVVAALFAFAALGRGGLAKEVGAPRHPAQLSARVFGVLRADHAVYLGTFLSIPIFALLVQRNQIAGILLAVFGGAAFLSILIDAVRSEKVERERLFAVLVLMFFSMLFWAFFEQAGSSLNNFTDRNVDRVIAERTIGPEDVGQTIPKLRLTQAQLGYELEYGPLTLNRLQTLREEGRRLRASVLAGREPAPAQYPDEVDWIVTAAHLGMTIGPEIPASEFQAANPIYILLFGLPFSALWVFLAARRREPTTPVKFALGLLQLGLGFGAFWLGAQNADGRGMVAVSWLLFGYWLQTTGELCLSPVGLSMVTRMSPQRIVSTVMGAWFLATAFSQYLAGLIATLTGVGDGDSGQASIPIPSETVAVYGSVFGGIALTAIASGILLLVIAPRLNRWMHESA